MINLMHNADINAYVVESTATELSFFLSQKQDLENFCHKLLLFQLFINIL